LYRNCSLILKFHLLIRKTTNKTEVKISLLQVIFRQKASNHRALLQEMTYSKRATNYRALLRKMTYTDKGYYESPRTGGRRPIGCLEVQVIFRKRAVEHIYIYSIHSQICAMTYAFDALASVFVCVSVCACVSECVHNRYTQINTL